MKKEEILKQLAERAYNVEFGACRNFATYDAITKIPDLITIGSIIIGILGLVWNDLTIADVSSIVLVLSVIGLYISRFTDNIDRYKEAGENLTSCYYKLKSLYIQLKDESSQQLDSYQTKYEEISKEIEANQNSKQIHFSDIRANFKFFQRDDLSWMDEQLHFSFFRDKIPYTLKAILWLIIIGLVAFVICKLLGLVGSIVVNWLNV